MDVNTPGLPALATRDTGGYEVREPFAVTGRREAPPDRHPKKQESRLDD